MATRRMCWHGHKEIHGISTKKPNHSTTLFAPALGDEFTKIYSVLSGNEELHNSSAYTSSLNMSMSIGEPLASSSPKATDNNVIIKNTSSKVIRDGIRILNMNCQSIKHNKDEMAVTIDSSEPDVIMFTVTWLHPSIKKNEFLPDTYEVHRRDQPTAAHGGVFLAIKKDLNSRDINWTKDANYVAPETEIVFVKIKRKGSILLSCYYRPQSSDLSYANSQIASAASHSTTHHPPYGLEETSIYLIVNGRITRSLVIAIPNLSMWHGWVCTVLTFSWCGLNV